MINNVQRFLKAARKVYRIYKESRFKEIHASDIEKYKDCFETITTLLEIYQPKYLCDIGANKGNWTYVMNQMNPHLKHVVCFEPQKEPFKNLENLTLPGVEKVLYNCGLGEQEDMLTIQGGTASASFLNPSLQNNYFPGSLVDTQETAQIKILDKIYAEDSIPYPDLIKVDVQGFELNVLKGARNVLAQAKILVLELSFQEFYSEQPPLWSLFKFLEENNYQLIGRGYEWRYRKNQTILLQMDGIFANTHFIQTL